MIPISAVVCGWLLLSILASKSQEFSIQKILPKLLSAPEYHYSGGPSPETRNHPSTSFLALEVEFLYQPQQENEDTLYGDDLLFTYYVFLNTRTQKYPEGILLVGSVSHTAVRARRKKYSVMYVAPSTLNRFFLDRVPSTVSQIVYDIGVTISKEGQISALKSWKGRGEWWKNYPQIVGLLLNKKETPFAPLLWENYEQILSKNIEK